MGKEGCKKSPLTTEYKLENSVMTVLPNQFFGFYFGSMELKSPVGSHYWG